MWVSNPTLAPVERVQPAPIAIQRVLPAIAPGTALNVLVAGSLRSGAYELLVNGQRLTALSEHRLEVGGQYRLQVVGQDAAGQVILKPIPESVSQLQAAIQQRLTLQLEPTRLMQALLSLKNSESPLAPSKEVAAFLGAFAQRRDISRSQGLACRMAKSGLFFEHILARGRDTADADLKGLLLKLRAFLTNQAKQAGTGVPTVSEEGEAPSSAKPHSIPSSANALYRSVNMKEQRPFSFGSRSLLTEMLNLDTVSGLKRAVEGAISRLEAQQLLALQAQQQNHTYLLFELPVMDRERLANWHIHVRDEADKSATDGGEAKTWTVVLSVDLPVVGPLSIKLTHSNESTEVIFYSERQPVCGLISNIIPDFTERLSRLGFSGVALSSHFGRLPEDDEPAIGYPSLHAQA